MTAAERDEVVHEITDILDAYATSVATRDMKAIDRFWGGSDGFVFAGTAPSSVVTVSGRKLLTNTRNRWIGG